MDIYSQNLSRSELEKVLSVARGDVAPDLLIKNIKLLDLVNGGVETTHIALCGETIAGIGLDYEGDNILDGKGLYIVPGFIDGHLHIESSMMHPFEFEKMTLPLGTTTAICDPHEITNVMGAEGFEWFLRCAELVEQNLFVQVSSCVPALPGMETNGAPFNLSEMKKYKSHPHVMGLAEMMNFPGVVNGDKEVLDKIEEFKDFNIDGHCPLVTGKTLNAYIAAGIQNCHETVSEQEGREKLQKGMSLIIREGSVAKNLDTLAPLVNEFSSPQCFLCTDDRNPFEIYHEGHINYLIKKLIKDNGIAPHVAYRLSSFSAAKHFGLKRLGLIAPGKKADFVLLENLEEVKIHEVFIGGKRVRDLDLAKLSEVKLPQSRPPLRNTMLREKLVAQDFFKEMNAGIYPVIEIIPEEIITNHLNLDFDGKNFEKDDVLKISVIERYGHQTPPAIGHVKGLGLREGAIASSVAHDSHNIIVIGENDEAMAVAANALIESGGGFVVVNGQNIVAAQVDLPVAGLISTQSAEDIAKGIEGLKVEFKKQGVSLEEPFIQMAFLALPVIPSLKITDKGLFDVKTFQFI